MAEQLELLLRFTPHVPRRHSANGWTADRQVAFIAALARSGVVSHAARSVGMTPRSAYSLRATVRNRYSNWADVPLPPDRLARLGPGYVFSFAAAWDLALARGLDRHLNEAVGDVDEQEPIIRRGRIIGWKRKTNIRLALTALGAFRRYHEGPSFDHDYRIAQRVALAHEKFETLLRLGPIDWDSAGQSVETMEERRARQRRERRLDKLYGRNLHGMRDPHGPADQPPRTLAQQDATLRSAARRAILDRGRRDAVTGAVAVAVARAAVPRIRAL